LGFDEFINYLAACDGADGVLEQLALEDVGPAVLAEPEEYWWYLDGGKLDGPLETREWPERCGW